MRRSSDIQARKKPERVAGSNIMAPDRRPAGKDTGRLFLDERGLVRLDAAEVKVGKVEAGPRR
jgi:hypothetical protein